ncbi:MAG: hypothetical protein AAF512_05295, partial [Pseudomonadota bacterium]
MKNNEKSLSNRLYIDQVSLLYKGSKSRPALHIISLIIFVSIIIDYVNPYYAYTWALLLFGINVFRLYDVAKIRNNLSEVTDYNIIH